MPRECNCAGPCGPAQDGMTRREFITIVGAGTAAALMGGPAWAKWVSGRGDGESLKRWRAELFKSAPKRVYRSDTHLDAQLPLGGIGTGNFEIGADGQFTTWQLFNTLRDGYIPFCFAVKSGSATKLLQTRGGPNWPRISAIETTGEYPFATLRFADADLPVKLEMTAFNPFSPLDAKLSSMPVACFVFKATNPTKDKITVSLAAMIQNPAGYDAMGVPISFNSVGFNDVPQRWEPMHPNFGGNFNRLKKSGKATALVMEAEPSVAPTLAAPVAIYANANIGGLNHLPLERPSNMTTHPVEALSDEKASDAKRVIWLEEPAADTPSERLASIRDAVKGGAALVIGGSAQPLLSLYGRVTDGKPLDVASLKPDVVFEDFESGYDKWTVEGDAFGKAPAQGGFPNQQPVAGFSGHGLANSYAGDDDAKGKLRSAPFKIERSYIRFLVGGGDFPETQIRLIAGNQTVRAASGKNEERLLPVTWDVREFVGKEARIEIVDERTGGWGHIIVDQIEFTDLPTSVDSMTILEELLPLRFSEIREASEDRIECADAAMKEGASRKSAYGRELVFWKVGEGTVALALGSIMNPGDAELIGARRKAYALLGAVAGFDYPLTGGVPAKAPGFGSLALATLGPGVTALPAFEDWNSAWTAFAKNGRFEKAEEHAPTPKTPTGRTVNGALASAFELEPGASLEVPFFLAWRYPNYYNSDSEFIGNHYAQEWKDIDSLTRKVASGFDDLRSRTEEFRKTLYDSTLPYWLLDALTSQISTIRHAGVVFRIANGDIYGWEGSNGCCQPTCTHVWGYEQTLSRIFPDMEREMRRIDYFHQQREDGGINNRTAIPSPPHPTGETPFSDGHSSCVLKAYREAMNAPDDSWMKTYWPRIKKAVDYLVDRDAAGSDGAPDGTLTDDQWNTYDNMIHGVNTFIGTYYLAALRAGEELAKRMGDSATAERYHGVFEKGRKRLVDLCWNGEYFTQNLPDYMERNGEYGPGCLSDQLIGQWWAHQLGLGYLLPEELVKKALASIFANNWLPDFTGFTHNWRKFAGGKDKGLLICTWPKGGRPANTIPYVDEVWTGVEYQVASHMIYEGMVEEGFAIVKGLRDRYDGVPRDPMPRNPWNEIECGGHYARAMSSWSVLLAVSGWEYDSPAHRLTFAPRHQEESFKSLFAASEGWGSLRQTRKNGTQKNAIAVVEGELKIAHLRLKAASAPTKAKVALGGKEAKTTMKTSGGFVEIAFAEPVTIRKGESLQVTLS